MSQVVTDESTPDPVTDAPVADAPVTDGAVADGAVSPTKDSTTPEAPRRSSATTQWLVTGLAGVAVVAALVAAIVFGMQGYQAYFGGGGDAQQRQAAVDGAEQAILNVTTIDPTDLEGWRANIDATLTGQAKQEVTDQVWENVRAQVEAAGVDGTTTLTSRIKRSAPGEFNDDEGTAKVLVYVDATSKTVDQPSRTEAMGFWVSMQRVEDRWLADGVTPLNAMVLETGSEGN